MSRNAILFGVSALLVLGGCEDQGFMNVVHAKGRNPVLNCRCPNGFTMNPAADGCTRETKVDPTIDPNGSTGRDLIQLGDTEPSYSSESLFFANADATSNWPMALEHGMATTDSTGAQVQETRTAMVPFWRNRIQGPNRMSIKSVANIWHTKTVCIDTPLEKTYSIFIGGDNLWNLKIDGLDYAHCANDYCFRDGRFLGQTLKSGKHLVEMKYYDYGLEGALWYEIYDQPIATVQTAAQESDLQVLFSTRNLVGQYWDYGGEICPSGYVYDTCANDNMCTKLEQSVCL